MPDVKVTDEASSGAPGSAGFGIATPPDAPISPVADSASARQVRARTYTTLTTPPDMAIQKLHATTSDYNASEGDGYPIGPVEGGLQALEFNKIFHRCASSGRRPADRVFLKSWKSFGLAEAEAHYQSNPDDYIALCYDISDYEECFWNYRTGSFCSADEAEQFDEVLEVVFQTKGSFLDDPVSDKHSFSCSAFDGSVIGSTSMQGWRSGNEDAHMVLPEIPGHTGIAATAILDGHGGARVAQYCSKQLSGHLSRLLPGTDYTAETLPQWDAVHRSLGDTFLAADDDVETNMNADHYGAAGTTLNLLLLTRHHYITANAGDSRLIVVREGGGFQRLTHDHKPDSPREKARIEEAGGRVADGRVEGLLAVSRALGDFDFKQAGGLEPQQQEVTPFPDVEKYARGPQDVAILQACDGIWDSMSEDDLARIVAEEIKQGTHPTQIAEKLCDKCLAPEICESGIGTDNMSLNILVLSKQ